MFSTCGNVRVAARVNSRVRVVLVARAARAVLEVAAGDRGEDGEATEDNDRNDRAGKCPWVALAAVVDVLSAADLCR